MHTGTEVIILIYSKTGRRKKKKKPFAKTCQSYDYISASEDPEFLEQYGTAQRRRTILPGLSLPDSGSCACGLIIMPITKKDLLSIIMN